MLTKFMIWIVLVLSVIGEMIGALGVLLYLMAWALIAQGVDAKPHGPPIMTMMCIGALGFIGLLVSLTSLEALNNSDIS